MASAGLPTSTLPSRAGASSLTAATAPSLPSQTNKNAGIQLILSDDDTENERGCQSFVCLEVEPNKRVRYNSVVSDSDVPRVEAALQSISLPLNLDITSDQNEGSAPVNQVGAHSFSSTPPRSRIRTRSALNSDHKLSVVTSDSAERNTIYIADKFTGGERSSQRIPNLDCERNRNFPNSSGTNPRNRAEHTSAVDRLRREIHNEGDTASGSTEPLIQQQSKKIKLDSNQIRGEDNLNSSSSQNELCRASVNITSAPSVQVEVNDHGIEMDRGRPWHRGLGRFQGRHSRGGGVNAGDGNDQPQLGPGGQSWPERGRGRPPFYRRVRGVPYRVRHPEGPQPFRVRSSNFSHAQGLESNPVNSRPLHPGRSAHRGRINAGFARRGFYPRDGSHTRPPGAIRPQLTRGRGDFRPSSRASVFIPSTRPNSNPTGRGASSSENRNQAAPRASSLNVSVASGQFGVTRTLPQSSAELQPAELGRMITSRLIDLQTHTRIIEQQHTVSVLSNPRPFASILDRTPVYTRRLDFRALGFEPSVPGTLAQMNPQLSGGTVQRDSIAHPPSGSMSPQVSAVEEVPLLSLLATHRSAAREFSRMHAHFFEQDRSRSPTPIRAYSSRSSSESDVIPAGGRGHSANGASPPFDFDEIGAQSPLAEHGVQLSSNEDTSNLAGHQTVSLLRSLVNLDNPIVDAIVDPNNFNINEFMTNLTSKRYAQIIGHPNVNAIMRLVPEELRLRLDSWIPNFSDDSSSDDHSREGPSPTRGALPSSNELVSADGPRTEAVNQPSLQCGQPFVVGEPARLSEVFTEEGNEVVLAESTDEPTTSGGSAVNPTNDDVSVQRSAERTTAEGAVFSNLAASAAAAAEGQIQSVGVAEVVGTEAAAESETRRSSPGIVKSYPLRNRLRNEAAHNFCETSNSNVPSSAGLAAAVTSATGQQVWCHQTSLNTVSSALTGGLVVSGGIPHTSDLPHIPPPPPPHQHVSGAGISGLAGLAAVAGGSSSGAIDLSTHSSRSAGVPSSGGGPRYSHQTASALPSYHYTTHHPPPPLPRPQPPLPPPPHSQAGGYSLFPPTYPAQYQYPYGSASAYPPPLPLNPASGHLLQPGYPPISSGPAGGIYPSAAPTVPAPPPSGATTTSSGGFLTDTFRRLRDSRRSQHPQHPPAGDLLSSAGIAGGLLSSGARGSSPSSSSRRSSGKESRSYWRSRSNTVSGGVASSGSSSGGATAASGTTGGSGRKSSGGSGGKRSSGRHTNSTNKNTTNTGTCASTSQHWSACAGKGGGSSSSSTSSSSSGSGAAGAAASALGLEPPPPGGGPSGVMSGATNSSSAALGAAAAGSAAAAASAPSSLGSGAVGILLDPGEDESEMGRLETLLAARGLPPSLFGSLAPRMHHLLNRSSASSSIGSKANQLLIGLQATGDEGQQLQALIEMCQLLVMGNEDTLAGFPIKQVTPALITLLNMEHNFDMMNHACRALTYMLEALPRSASVIVDAVPVFLQKLQVIQCMDVAEQSLTALEALSKKHSKAILQAGGIASCLMYLDFFSLPAARAALTITANCCLNITPSTYHFVEDSLPILANRISPTGDKKCVESACLAYSRLIDNFHHNPEKLRLIAKHSLLSNMQALVVAVPSLLSSSSLILVLRQMAVLCSNCPPLAVELLTNDVAGTLVQLITVNGSAGGLDGEELEISARTPQEQYEIANLACELLPSLPNTGMFAVDYSLGATYPSSSTSAKYTALPPLPVSSLPPSLPSLTNPPPPPLPNMAASGGVPPSIAPSMPLVTDSLPPPPPQLAAAAAVVHQPTVVPSQQGDEACPIPVHLLPPPPLTSLPPPPPPPPPASVATTTSTSDASGPTDELTAAATTAAASNGSSPSPAVSTAVSVSVWQWQDGRQAWQVPPAAVTAPKPEEEDPRKVCLESNPELAANFLRRVFNLVYEVYYKSAGPAVKHCTLKALLRMAHYASPALLEEVIRPQHFSSQLATMLSSSDLKIVVSALQLADLLMKKLQEVFSVYFRREGVLHQIKKLSEPPVPPVRSLGSSMSVSVNSSTPPPSQRNSFLASGSYTPLLGSTGVSSSSATNILAPPLPGSLGGGSLYAGAEWLSIDPTVSGSVALSASPLLAAARSINDSLGDPSMSLSLHNASMPHLASASPMNSSHLPLPVMGSTSAHSSLAPSPAPNPSLVHSYPPQHGGVSDGLAPISQLLEPSISVSSHVTSLTGADVLKKKRSSRMSSGGGGGSGGGGRWRSRRQEEPAAQQHATSFGEFFMKSLSSTANSPDVPMNTSTSNASSRASAWHLGGASSTHHGGRSASSAKTHGGGSSSTSSSSSSSRGAGSGRSGSSFLANLNPVRWGRCSSSATPPQEVKEKNVSSRSNSYCSPASLIPHHPQTSCSSSSSSSSRHRESVRTWVREQAMRLDREHFGLELQGLTHPALTVLNRLIGAIQQLHTQPGNCIPALTEMMHIVTGSDISSFELIHSGLVHTLLLYLTATDKRLDKDNITKGAKDHQQLHDHLAEIAVPGTSSGAAVDDIVAGRCDSAKASGGSGGGASPINSGAVEASAGGALEPAVVANIVKTPRDERLRSFLHVFLGCSLDPLEPGGGCDASVVSRFTGLLSKLMSCVNQLEQFPVKVHDLPSGGGTGSRGGATSAIKFLNTHQLKCNLQRDPSCTRLREWRGGPVKVDPLALVQAIERYLVVRGYARLRDHQHDDNSDDDNTDDDDIDDNLASISSSQSSQQHKLEFLIGDQVLPYNMTVYQALRHYSQELSPSDAENEGEVPVSQSAVWLHTHTIYYRPVMEEPPVKSSRKGKGGSKSSPKKKLTESLVTDAALIGGSSAVLDSLLCATLPPSVTVKDPSLEVLTLVRVLSVLNRHYHSLYPPAPTKLPVPMVEFQNVKLTAKANRQLQDPLVIMTGNLPPWLPQIAYACPFLFPFETRQLLFYAVSFDRDRAIQRLQETNPELNHGDSTERVTPRLDRKKKTVSREDILKQAESVINDLVPSKALLEIQYSGEVGSGLGPTLEFYAIVSREMKKAELELWRGQSVAVEEETVEGSSKTVKYVNAATGLYPMPLPKTMKSAAMNKIKQKFKFLGKFMAKAVMDSRMVDLSLHECMLKWMLGEERSLGLADVLSLDPEFGGTLRQLHALVLQKRRVQDQARVQGYTTQQLESDVKNITLDGCSVEDLSLNFTLPGYPNIELKKGGADSCVTIDNLDQYLQLVVEWLLREGVWRQMEAFKEGFDSVFPMSQLQVFYPEELEQVFCGSSTASHWDVKVLAECCKPDHGYTHDSRSVKFLLQILSEYSPKDQRNFLQFTTGSPRLPVGGFRSLSPPLTIVRKTFEANENPDDFLPSVMTCVNYLKLPDYSTYEIMKEKLGFAISEGQHSFHLS